MKVSFENRDALKVQNEAYSSCWVGSKVEANWATGYGPLQ